jgi:AcrR family transcriptional regulator
MSLAHGKVGTLLSARPLTELQAARLNRLREAATELASEGGYGAVTMRAVAERADVGLATVYRYFSSKDHLIADVQAMKSAAVLERLHTDPPSGGTAAERVSAVFCRMLEATAEDLNLASAGVSAIASADPNASSPEYWQKIVMVSYMDVALGDEDVGDRQELGAILGHVFFSLMVGMAGGRHSLKESKDVMKRAVNLILDR